MGSRNYHRFLPFPVRFQPITCRRFLMRRITMLAGIALSGAVLTAACTTDPYTGQRRINNTAVGIIGGALGGYLLGDLVGGHGDRTEKVIGAGIGAIAGGAVGAYMDVDVIRQGDDLILRMPSGITFPVDRYDIQPQFRSTLDGVAQTLASYNQTYIDVLGHTDSDGSDAYNQTLSERRAGAVADYLAMRGVARARMGIRGFGETAPIASNATIEGKAQNRRVEIKVVPVTQPGY
jgi:outer membrane protein OmpA-like peptidoglycan-associated protein